MEKNCRLAAVRILLEKQLGRHKNILDHTSLNTFITDIQQCTHVPKIR